MLNFLVADWHMKTQATVGGVISEQMGLGCIRKVDGHTMRSKPVAIFPPRSLLRFLTPDACLNSWLGFPQSWTVDKAEINPSLSKVGFSLCFIPGTESELEQDHTSFISLLKFLSKQIVHFDATVNGKNSLLIYRNMTVFNADFIWRTHTEFSYEV